MSDVSETLIQAVYFMISTGVKNRKEIATTLNCPVKSVKEAEKEIAKRLVASFKKQE